MRSRSSSTETRARIDVGACTATARAPPIAMRLVLSSRPPGSPRRCPGSPGDDLLHLAIGPGHRLLGRRAGDGLGQHVGEDEGIGYELDLVAGRRRPAVAVELHALLLQRREL